MSFTSFKKRYKIELNRQQEEAVQAVNGAVLLLAVPGSGKTTVLIDRLGYMIFDCGVDPENILTITYTDAATKDMKQRFIARFGQEYGNQVEFRTINGISHKILMYYGRKIGQKPYEIIENRVKAALLKNIYKNITGKFSTENDIKNIETGITYVKNMRLSREEIIKWKTEVDRFPDVYNLYQKELKNRNLIDYDDQMVYALMILEKIPGMLEYFRGKYRYICVDEAQDTSKLQHDLIDLLAGEDGNLFMVGDEDQSIFGFRAAYPEALISFEKRYKNGKVLLMEPNYRSNEEIVTAANMLIRDNKNRHDKNMTAIRPSGGKLNNIAVRSRKAQYSYLIKVARNCDRETAILYRNNESALPLIDVLERENIPYRMKNRDMTFFTHPVVTDISDYIRLCIDPCDDEAFLNIYYKMGAGISKVNAQKAVEMNRRKKPLMELMDELDISSYTRKKCRALATHFRNMRNENTGKAIYRILNFMGYSEYLNDHGMDAGKTEILQLLGDQESDIFNFLPHLENLREVISNRPGDDKCYGRGSVAKQNGIYDLEEEDSNLDIKNNCNLILSTIHSSKGLEYDRVYMIDMMNGILPSAPDPAGRKNADQAEIAMYEEERRLYYVGMTRAKNELDIFTFGDIDTSSFSKKVFGMKETDRYIGKKSSGLADRSFPEKRKSTAKKHSEYKKIRTDYSGKK